MHESKTPLERIADVLDPPQPPSDLRRGGAIGRGPSGETIYHPPPQPPQPPLARIARALERIADALEKANKSTDTQP